MVLQYTVFFECIFAACAFHWTTRITMKNHENSPILNTEDLGPLQMSWERTQDMSNETYYLMFSSIDYNRIKCVSARATITDETKKTANYTITYMDEEWEWKTLTFQVMALKQTDYSLENVLRESLSDEPPSPIPSPLGSNSYTEYNNYSCHSYSSPFVDKETSQAPKEVKYSHLHDARFRKRDGSYLDSYMVYTQPTCNVISIHGGCEFWLRKTELKMVLEAARNETANITDAEIDSEVEEERKKYRLMGIDEATINIIVEGMDDIFRKERLKTAIFKSLPSPCRFAFLVACDVPTEAIYDPDVCKSSPTQEAGDKN